MNTSKILIGTLVAGVALFFLGWLIYGIALSSIMAENCNSGNARPMDQMVWWALILSNLVWGLLLTLIIDWSNNTSVANGAKVGAVLGLLTGLGFDLSMYAMTTMYSNPGFIIVDVLAFALMFAIAGAAVAFVVNKVKV